MSVCGLPTNKSPTAVRNREVPGRVWMSLLMKMQQKANQLLLSIIGLLTKSYLLCLIVYLLHLMQMKTMLMHGSIGINIRAVIALICFDYQLKTL